MIVVTKNVTTISRRETPDHEVWEKCFRTNNAKRKLSQQYPSRFQEILPGVSSGDPRFHKLQRSFSDIADETIPHEPEDGFAPDSGVASSFSVARTASGYMGTPAGHVLYDNTLKRSEELGLGNSDFRDDVDRRIFEELCDCMFSYADYRGLKVAAKSSQGLPRVEYEKDVKVRDAKTLLEPKNFQKLVRACQRGDGRTLLEDLGVVCAFVQNYRNSPDVFGKVRKTPDLTYAMSGGREGKLVTIDKTVFGLDGTVIDGIQGCRPRLVMGMNNPINIVLSSWRAGVARYYGNEYAYTWKHTGADNIASKVEDYLKLYPQGHVTSIDVTQFDASVPRFLITYLLDYGKNRFFSEEFAIIARKALFAPVFQPETGDGLGAFFHGNPLTMEELPAPGLMSGVDWVSLLGKLINVFNALVVLRDMRGEAYIVGRIHSFLRGQLDIRLLNAGDDGLLLTPDDETTTSFFRAAKTVGYLNVDREKACQFLGYVLQRSGGRIRCLNNVISYVKNTLVPERAWDSKLRPFWHIGLAERFKTYDNNPSFQSVLDILDHLWPKSFPEQGKYTTFVERLIRENRYNIPEAESEVDAIFLANPSSIHYKISEDDVSPHLLDAEFANIDLIDYEHLIGDHLLSRAIN